ncbi:DUF4129 domain-containing protein [Mycobacteroides abscessus]|uniref:DUF4129 domain-containing protein n=1 Tax=Mycobacteroides abscessus TaxID=36809 RepID=UPI000C25DE21|nr:DUF4129 domain-containing protein [Mycobacteroides abscessus]
MTGADRPLLRATGLIVLIALSVVALRGYLPDAAALPPPEKPRAQPHSNALQLLLCGVVSILILVSLRRQRPSMPLPQENPPYLRLPALTRREAIIAAATVLVLMGGVWTALYLSGPAGEGPVREPASRSAEPTRPGTEPPAPGKPSPRRYSEVPMMILGVVLVGIAAAVFVLRRHEPDAPDGSTGQPAEPDAAPTTPRSLVHLVELGLAEVAEPGRDPRAAIIACYAAMEQGLTAAPEAAPLESDTPSEVLQRAVHIGALQSQAGTQLVSLFSEARFSPHEMTQAHRQSAARWLQDVVDDLRSRQ